MVKKMACCSWSGSILILKTWAARPSLVPPVVVAGVDPVVVLLMARDTAWSAWACLQFRRGGVLLSAEFSVLLPGEVSSGITVFK